MLAIAGFFGGLLELHRRILVARLRRILLTFLSLMITDNLLGCRHFGAWLLDRKVFANVWVL
jgi:hypothetical protein